MNKHDSSMHYNEGLAPAQHFFPISWAYKFILKKKPFLLIPF